MKRGLKMAAMVAAEEVRPLKVKGWTGMFVREMSARDASVARKLIDDEGKRDGGAAEHEWIGCFHLEEQGLRHATDREGDHDPHAAADEGHDADLPQHHTADR